MASKKQPPAPQPPQVPPRRGIELLQKQIDEGEVIGLGPVVEHETLASWALVTRNYLVKAFGEGSRNVTDVVNAGRSMSSRMGAPQSYYDQERRNELNAKMARLRALLQVLETEAESAASHAAASADAPVSQQRSPKRSVFLVHGHDERYLAEAESFLRKLKLSVTVLRDQPSRGQTIIEKFEQHGGEADFAVVLLTPDDFGRSKAEAEGVLRPRARQNVVMELGWFLAKLKRSHVCALHGGRVELPSDFSGVLYVSLDDSSWKYLLAKELRAAGLPVDMNDV